MALHKQTKKGDTVFYATYPSTEKPEKHTLYKDVIGSDNRLDDKICLRPGFETLNEHVFDTYEDAENGLIAETLKYLPAKIKNIELELGMIAERQNVLETELKKCQNYLLTHGTS